MYIPQEIQDYIIDIIAQSVPTKPKKDLSNLRFVCRAWIARVDFHLFRDLRMEAAQGPKLLSMVKSSKFSIGLRVRKLSIYGGASLSNRTLFPYYDNEVALQEYAKEFVESLPFLESLELLSLYPDQISWVPCFPTIKSLALPNVSVWPSLILRLISAARSLETLICDDCDVYEEGNIDFGTLPALLQDSICFKTLKAYEALIGWYNDITYLTSYLFPSHLEPDLPSLTSLSLKGVHSGTIRIAMHLLKAVSRSLRFLQLWFGRGDDENDEQHPQKLDLSSFQRLEFIRFLNLEASYAEEFNELDIFLHGVRSLPSTLTELTVSLCFCDIYEDHQNYISQIDSVLGTSSGVKMVEVIPGVRGDQEKMRAGFPKLMSQNRLDVKAGWSEAEQIFST